MAKPYMENVYAMYGEDQQAKAASSGGDAGFPEIIFQNISATSSLRPNAQDKSFTSRVLAASF